MSSKQIMYFCGQEKLLNTLGSFRGSTSSFTGPQACIIFLSEFEKGGFTLKTHQAFPIHRLITKQSLVILDLHLRKTRAGKVTQLSLCHRFGKLLFSKCFPSTLNRQAGVFKFLRRFEERFRKAPIRFRDGLVWMVHPTVEIKLRFQISFSGVLLTWPYREQGRPCSIW